MDKKALSPVPRRQPKAQPQAMRRDPSCLRAVAFAAAVAALIPSCAHKPLNVWDAHGRDSKKRCSIRLFAEQPRRDEPFGWPDDESVTVAAHCSPVFGPRLAPARLDPRAGGNYRLIEESPTEHATAKVTLVFSRSNVPGPEPSHPGLIVKGNELVLDLECQAGWHPRGHNDWTPSHIDHLRENGFDLGCIAKLPKAGELPGLVLDEIRTSLATDMPGEVLATSVYRIPGPMGRDLWSVRRRAQSFNATNEAAAVVLAKKAFPGALKAAVERRMASDRESHSFIGFSTTDPLQKWSSDEFALVVGERRSWVAKEFGFAEIIPKNCSRCDAGEWALVRAEFGKEGNVRRLVFRGPQVFSGFFQAEKLQPIHVLGGRGTIVRGGTMVGWNRVGPEEEMDATRIYLHLFGPALEGRPDGPASDRYGFDEHVAFDRARARAFAGFVGVGAATLGQLADRMGPPGAAGAAGTAAQEWTCKTFCENFFAERRRVQTAWVKATARWEAERVARSRVGCEGMWWYPEAECNAGP